MAVSFRGRHDHWTTKTLRLARCKSRRVLLDSFVANTLRIIRGRIVVSFLHEITLGSQQKSIARCPILSKKTLLSEVQRVLHSLFFTPMKAGETERPRPSSWWFNFSGTTGWYGPVQAKPSSLQHLDPKKSHGWGNSGRHPLKNLGGKAQGFLRHPGRIPERWKVGDLTGNCQAKHNKNKSECHSFIKM